MDNKRIDESWKEKVEHEKTGNEVSPAPDSGAETAQGQIPEVSFVLFISSLGMQALMSLGELENPVTNKKEKDLPQAKYLIDTLDMIKDKTRNNLSNEEAQMLEDMVYELKTKYLSVSN